MLESPTIKQQWQTPILVDMMKIERVTEGEGTRRPPGPEKYTSEAEFTNTIGDTTNIYYEFGPNTT